jgi:hypothetical protein
MALPAHSRSRPLIQFRNHFHRRQDSLDEWSARRKATGQHKHRLNAYTHTHTHTHTNIHGLSGIRTYDHGCRANEDSSCLRPHGYCDRQTMNYGQYNVNSTSTTLAFEIISAVDIKTSVFWDITPCCPVKVNDVSEEHVTFIFRVEEEAKEETSMKHSASYACFVLCSSFDHSFTLKVEAVCSSETSIDFHRTTRRYIPEDRARLFVILQLCIFSICCVFPLGK